MIEPSPQAEDARLEERVLILAPSGRDGALTREILEKSGLGSFVCADNRELCSELQRGAGAALIAEEALGTDAVGRLVTTLGQQPPWSDFPIVLFSSRAVSRSGAEGDRLALLGNVTVLERPVNVRTMLAGVHAALRARRRQYEARRAIHARDEFLAMLGHELRNPLGAIRLAAEVLAGTDDLALRERNRLVIDRQSRHLAGLVDGLLDVTRLMHGKVSLQQQRVDLRELLDHCVQSFEPLARQQHISISVKLPDQAFFVLGDHVRLEQIFGNIIANALTYSPEHGTVAVTAELANGAVVVRVIDSGIGLEPSMLKRVFEPFTQADPTIDRTKGGMGLGLALVRSFVALHGGEVTAESEGLGRGSEFRVTLPLHAQVDAESPSSGVSSGRGSARFVVLVEDNEDIRTTLAELLSAWGHRVEAESDGPSGLARILEAEPDVALVDIGLPGLSGYELARSVRARNSKTRLIAVSGYGQKDDKMRALEAGFELHLTKPVGFDELQMVLAADGLHMADAEVGRVQVGGH